MASRKRTRCRVCDKPLRRWGKGYCSQECAKQGVRTSWRNHHGLVAQDPRAIERHRPHGNRLWTLDEVDRLEKLWKDGAKRQAMREEFGCTTGSLAGILRRSKLVTPRGVRGPQQEKRYVPPRRLRAVGAGRFLNPADMRFGK